LICFLASLASLADLPDKLEWWSGSSDEKTTNSLCRQDKEAVSRQRRRIQHAEEAFAIGSFAKIRALAMEALEDIEGARARCNNIRGVESGDIRVSVRIVRHV